MSALEINAGCIGSPVRRNGVEGSETGRRYPKILSAKCRALAAMEVHFLIVTGRGPAPNQCRPRARARLVGGRDRAAKPRLLLDPPANGRRGI